MAAYRSSARQVSRRWTNARHYSMKRSTPATSRPTGRANFLQTQPVAFLTSCSPSLQGVSLRVIRRRHRVVDADLLEVFIRGFIFKLSAVIEQKYLGSAKTQDYSLPNLFQYSPGVGFADGHTLHPASEQIFEYQDIFLSVFTLHERPHHVSCDYLPRLFYHSLLPLSVDKPSTASRTGVLPRTSSVSSTCGRLESKCSLGLDIRRSRLHVIHAARLAGARAARRVSRPHRRRLSLRQPHLQ